MKICIFTTADNVYLGNLLKRLAKKNLNLVFLFTEEHSLKFNNLNKIIVRILSIGFFSCAYFFLRDVVLKILRKDIVNILKKKSIVLVNETDNKKIIKFLKKNQIDLILSINYPQKITKEILNIPKKGGCNLHLGELPNFKGLYPVMRTILDGKKYVTLTFHKMNYKIDRGRIINKKKIFYSKKDSIMNIYKIMFDNSYSFILESLKLIKKNKRIKKYITKKNSNYYGKATALELKKLILYRLKSSLFY